MIESEKILYSLLTTLLFLFLLIDVVGLFSRTCDKIAIRAEPGHTSRYQLQTTMPTLTPSLALLLQGRALSA